MVLLIRVHPYHQIVDASPGEQGKGDRARQVRVSCGHRTCGTSRDSCHAQLSINHRPLDRFRYVTFWIRLDDSLLSVGVLVGRSAARRRSIEFARWSPTPPRRLSTTVRYIAVSNELNALSFALYRDVDVNTCYVNETVALRTQSTQQSLTVTVITFRVRRKA